MIPNLLSSNLNYMSKIFGLTHQKAHRALDDAKASADLLLKYLTIFVDKDIQKINNLYYPKNRFELDRINYKKTHSKIEIAQKIKNITQPFIATFKGVEGVVLYSLVVKGNDLEKNFIISKLDEIQYETFTLKLVGPFFQGLIELSSYFSKIKEQYQKEILEFLCREHQIDLEKVNAKDEIAFPADFIIMNHLVPEQYLIYPTKALHQKMELVFRYPSHQNKLVQYINSKSSKLNQGKMKEDHIPKNLKNLMSLYLIEKNEVLGLLKNNQKITTQDIKTDVENYILNNPNNYGFPQNFL